MTREQEALDEFLKEYLFLCEKLHTNMQEKMLLDGNSPYNVLRQAFTKAPEPIQTGSDLGVIKPNHYLKWEDLKFDDTPARVKTKLVRMNGNVYELKVFHSGGEKFALITDTLGKLCGTFREYNSHFFNDLHLERVE